MLFLLCYLQFAQGPFLRGLYPNVPPFENQTIPEYVRDMVLSENRPIGVPRVRQVRVRNDSCVVHEDFRNVIKTCYGTYSSSAEQKTPFGLMNDTASVDDLNFCNNNLSSFIVFPSENIQRIHT